MAGNIPPKPTLDQIVWFETRLPQWSATPTAFGTTAAAVTSLSTLVAAARKAYNDAQAARVASKDATQTEAAAVSAMLGGGRPLVNTMKTFIEASHNAALWGQSGLSPSAPPSPAPNPVAPHTVTAALDVDGDVVLAWKTSQPAGLSGVTYSIRRALDGGPYALLDSVGGKTFTDTGVPAGTQSVSYTIQGRRGAQASAWSPALTVRFGRAGGGLTITSSETASSGSSDDMKLAA